MHHAFRPYRLAPWMLLIIGLLPVAGGILYALLYSLGCTGTLAKGFTLEYWQRLMTDAAFWKSLVLSMTMAATVVGSAVLLAMALSIYLRTHWLPAGIPTWLYLPNALPPLVAAFIGYQLFSGTGWLSRLAFQSHWISAPEQFPALIQDKWHIAVFFTLLFLQFPVFLLLFLSYFRDGEIQRLEQLAGSLGATPAQQCRRVTVPLLWQKIKTPVFAYGIFLTGAYEIPFVLGAQHPGMLSVFIHQKFKKYNLDDIPQAYAAAVVYALLVGSLTFFVFRKKNMPPNE
jgi:putative spermidine/putrescine transport system permease protein